MKDEYISGAGGNWTGQSILQNSGRPPEIVPRIGGIELMDKMAKAPSASTPARSANAYRLTLFNNTPHTIRVAVLFRNMEAYGGWVVGGWIHVISYCDQKTAVVSDVPTLHIYAETSKREAVCYGGRKEDKSIDVVDEDFLYVAGTPAPEGRNVRRVKTQRIVGEKPGECVYTITKPKKSLLGEVAAAATLLLVGGGVAALLSKGASSDNSSQQYPYNFK